MGTFKEQTKRLEKLYGFHPTQVLTGKDVFKTLVDETQKHGSLLHFLFLDIVMRLAYIPMSLS